MNALRLFAACHRTRRGLVVGADAAGLRAGQRRHRRRHPRQGDGREGSFPTKRPYSPWAGRNFPTRPLFGDTHLHTIVLLGCRRLRRAPRARATPIASRKGEEIIASSGQLAKLSRPLDFLVVTDHSDNMGFFPDLLAGKPELLADPTGRRWYDMIQSGKGADGGGRDHHRLRRRARSPDRSSTLPGTPRLPLGVAGDHRRRRGGERSRPLHRLHRL